MSIIFLAVLIAASILWGSAMGWRWLAGCWALFVLGSFLGSFLDVPMLGSAIHAVAALVAAIKGVSSNSTSSLFDRQSKS